MNPAHVAALAGDNGTAVFFLSIGSLAGFPSVSHTRVQENKVTEHTVSCQLACIEPSEMSTAPARRLEGERGARAAAAAAANTGTCSNCTYGWHAQAGRRPIHAGTESIHAPFGAGQSRFQVIELSCLQQLFTLSSVGCQPPSQRSPLVSGPSSWSDTAGGCAAGEPAGGGGGGRKFCTCLPAFPAGDAPGVASAQGAEVV